MLVRTVAAVINHLLQGASWAPQRLKPFAGKTARFRIFPFDLALTVQDTGEVAEAFSEAVADTTFSLTPGLWLRILAQDETAYQEVETSGDSAFANEILYLAKNLRWDVEEDLSRVMGDILAHRMVQTGERLMDWRRQAMLNFAEALVEYWTEEQPLIAKSIPLRQFIREVDTLRDDVERIEKRIARLSPKLNLPRSNRKKVP